MIISVTKYLFCLVTLSTLLFTMSSCQSGKKLEQGEARVKGRIVNPTRDFIEFKKQTDAGTKKDTIRLNEKGEFEFVFRPDSLEYYTFAYGIESTSDTMETDVKTQKMIVSRKTQELTLMLDKGHDLKIWVDTKDPMKSLSVSGTGTEVNKYTATKAMLDNEFNLAFSKKLNSSPKEFFTYLTEYKSNIDALLNSLPANSKSMPDGFRDEEARKLFLNINRIKIVYVNQNMGKDTEAGSFIPEGNYFSFMNDIPLDKPEVINDKSYLLLISSYADYLLKSDNRDKQLTREELLAGKYSIYKELFKDPGTRDRVLFEFLKKYNKQNDAEWYKRAAEDFARNSSSDSLKLVLANIKEIREKLSKGNPAPGFTYTDSEGKEHSLADFKGKYVYIDVWATWCKPCQYEVSFLKQLEEEYKNRNIEFISISIDDNKEQWMKFLSEKGLKGIQLHAGSESQLMKDYMIEVIPRFIFVGPGGEMISEEAPRPSSAEIRELLNSFLAF
mgnify:CR=1 FL=1